MHHQLCLLQTCSMELFSSKRVLPPLMYFVYFYMLWFCITNPNAQAALIKERALNNTISAILVFGDSTVDPGNNNYVKTIFKSNFRPYGRDFPNQRPSGRFTNGRLCTDYIASYMGIKEYVPPYLEPKLPIEELMTGVSFASAGSGFDPLTPKIINNVIPIQKQLEYFKVYKQTLEAAMGKQRAEIHIKKAAFLVSAGTNDFVLNYFGVPIRPRTYTISQYQLFVLQRLQDFVQGLWAEGARRIAVVGLPPMGCLPMVITLNSDNTFLRRGCVANYSLVATQYNLMLQNYLNFMQTSLAYDGARIYYVNIFDPLMNMIIQGHEKFGFDVVDRGCCGTGYLETTILCNPSSYLCRDSNKYVFWDAMHPTQNAYYYIFKAVRNVVDSLIQD